MFPRKEKVSYWKYQEITDSFERKYWLPLWIVPNAVCEESQIAARENGKAWHFKININATQPEKFKYLRLT